MKTSFVELTARERAFHLLDNKDGKELLGPFDEMMSPHLEPQGIVPESDDGVVLVKGNIQGKNSLVISIEGDFQGGGIGEVSGAKIAIALELALEENKKGNSIYPVIILDTGGVRLQEANYGLLSISEIGNMIVALKEFVPVVGVIPGLVGSFGGMSITASLMSYLITTKKARVGLNGPEVIEQEAGVMEFDASDKALIWETIGSRQRLKTELVDEFVEDDVNVIKEAVTQAIIEKKDVKRTERSSLYLSLLNQLSPEKLLTPREYNEIYAKHQATDVVVEEAVSGEEKEPSSNGEKWFAYLTGINNPKSNIGTVLHKTILKNEQERIYISIVPDKENKYYRVRDGEVGLVEGHAVASIVSSVIKEDENKDLKRPIILIIDVPSQAYGYNEELIGIHLALASSSEYYARARQKGHPVIGVMIGNAISGAFLAHGLQSNRLIAIGDDKNSVQAMSKESAARITNRTIEELEKATEKVPAMAYDIYNFAKLGALYRLIDDVDGSSPSKTDIKIIENTIEEAILSTIDQPKDLSFRYETEAAKTTGRVATREVRKKVREQW